jgi:hypothetical protein
MDQRRLLLATLISVAGCADQPARTEPTAVATPTITAQVRPSPAAPVSAPTKASPLPVAQDEEPRLTVEGEGLRWFLPPNGSARPIPFGTPQAAVLASLEGVRGPAGTGVNRNCGVGPVEYASWPDGLNLVFQRGGFVGWSLDGRAEGALSTANGVGPGTTHAELDRAFARVRAERTTLGTEFSAGAIYGVLAGPGRRARITDMWAGVSCVAR